MVPVFDQLETLGTRISEDSCSPSIQQHIYVSAPTRAQAIQKTKTDSFSEAPAISYIIGNR